MLEPTENYEQIRKNIVNAGVDWLVANPNVSTFVIGISGGIDSALTVALAREIANEAKANFGSDYRILGRFLEINGNKPDEKARAKAIGEAFCDDYDELDLSEAYKFVANDFEANDVLRDEDVMQYKIRQGNIKARLRMIRLYDYAGQTNGVVLSTDNLTELLLGFWTLHGDVGDLGFIQNLWKTEVYGLSKYLAGRYAEDAKLRAMMDCVNAVPTDGLGITNSDLDQLGADTYEQVDGILQMYFTNPDGIPAPFETHPVIQRHIRSQFKRDNPVNLTRETLLDKI